MATPEAVEDHDETAPAEEVVKEPAPPDAVEDHDDAAPAEEVVKEPAPPDAVEDHDDAAPAEGVIQDPAPPDAVEDHDDAAPAEDVIQEPAPTAKKAGKKKKRPSAEAGPAEVGSARPEPSPGPSLHASRSTSSGKAGAGKAGKGWPREVVILGMVLSGIAGALLMDNLPRWSPRAAAMLGSGRGASAAALAPLGSTVELTLVAADRENLACATDAEIGGLRCGFGADGKPRAGAEPAATLQPFTTTDRRSILGAGLWQDPAMAKAKLPKKRFRVKCDFAAAGEAANPKVRWAPGEFKGTTSGWPAGRLSNCTVLQG